MSTKSPTGRSRRKAPETVVEPDDFTKPAPLGRPRKISDDLPTQEQLFKLGQLDCTHVEAASWFGVCEKTLYNAFDAFPALREAFARGKGIGMLSYRRRLMASNSPHVLIHMSKNLLGMTDKLATTNDHNHTFTMKGAMELTDEQLDARLAALLRNSVERLPPASGGE